MTHDELLDRIAQAGLEPHGNVMPTHLVLALRAVVELTKDHADRGEYADGYRAAMKDVFKAIEKELM
jgi:hypothetical protein